MALSTTQQLILDKAEEGHPLLILGQSGTGKSHLVKEIACELLRAGYLYRLRLQLELLL